MKAEHKTYCQFAKSVDDKREKNKKVFIIMFRMNDGEFWFEAMNHVRKTKLGVFKIANTAWYSKSREMKIIEVDLTKAKLLFQGFKTEEKI